MALAGQTQLRTSFAGVVGFDLPALLQLGEAMGVARAPLAVLLPYVERGLLAGLNKQQQSDESSE